MDNSTPARHSTAPTSTLPRAERPAGLATSRFSPASAPERETIDRFCEESRAWALRQARRSYRHLPESLREQAVERALTEMRTRAPRSAERRALAADLADRLTEALRHVHVGWCLNESSALLRREGTEPVQPEVRRESLANFVDEGLGGLERAVLQLEIGAGRDTHAARAALRLGPRQYSAHREAGLSKLRDAIAAQIIGRACDQHVSSIVSAATGDRQAMQTLSSGRQRCRYCAREAQGLRSVLHERLAVAPWPLLIKPASLLALKLGAVGAVVGGGGKAVGTGAGALSLAGGSGASAAATVLAVAALATGTAAVVDGERTEEAGTSAVTQRISNTPAAGATKATAASLTGREQAGAKRRAAGRATVNAQSDKGANRRPRRNTGSGGTTTTAATPTTPAAPTSSGTTAATTTSPGSGSGPVTTATKPVTETVEQTTKQVTSQLPSAVAEPVDQTVDTVTGTLDDVTGAVDGLLPKP